MFTEIKEPYGGWRAPSGGEIADSRSANRELSVKPEVYGWKSEKVEEIIWSETLVPVREGSNEVAIRVLQDPKIRWKKERKEEDSEDVGVTLVYMGGSTSPAASHGGDFGLRAIEAVEALREDGEKVKINNIVILSHPAGSPQTGEDKYANDLGFEARVLNQVLRHPDIKLSGKIVVGGLSYGGETAIALAAEMEQKPEVLFLMEPGGVAENDPNKLMREFAVGDFIKIYNRYRNEGKNRRQALRGTWAEITKSMTSVGGEPKYPWNVIGNLFKPDRDFKKVATMYGMEKVVTQSAGETANKAAKDLTRTAREALAGVDIIFSPVIPAKVVNVATKAIEGNEIDLKNKIETEGAIKEIIEALFPKSKVRVVPSWLPAHTSAASQQEYMDNLMKEICLTLLEKSEHEGNSGESGEKTDQKKSIAEVG